ncbi:MAG TPA: hypothetical protein VMU13_00320 [Candidatus Paceibacterota bacterium]|nr:hypothetical protein [Candidatus Paceibacterota bacterium]
MPPRHEPSHEDEKIERLRRAMYSRELEPNIHERDRHVLDTREQTIGDDWARDEPKLEPLLVAPRSINIVRTALWWLLGASIIFFIGAVGFFFWFFTFGAGGSGASSSNIDIVITGPASIAGGEVTELQIAITNKNSVPLSLANLTINYPPGTRSPADFTTPQLTYPIDLGTIQPGETKEGTVKAVLAGTEGQQSDVKAQLDYHLGGSNAIFTATSDYAFTFSSSPLSIAIASGASQAISGQPMTMAVTVASNSNEPIKDVLLGTTFPFGFQFTSSNPSAIAPGVWAVGTLNPGQKQTVTINGILTGNTGDDRVFNFTTGTRTSAASSSIDVPLGSIPFDVAIAQPFMGLTILVNNASSSPAVITPDEKITVTINYQNNLSTDITNAVVVAQLSGFQIDGTTVSSPDGFYRSNDNTVLWNQTTTNGNLALLTPGQSGQLTFSFTAPSSAVLANTPNPSIGISINAAGNRVDETGVPQNLQSVATSKLTIASNVALRANGLYYASPYGSVGPVPPQAGVETTYAMVLTLTNTTNQIDNAVVTATLPPYVRTTGKQSPSYENLKFNLDTGTVTWNVGTVAAGVGTNGVEPRQVAFEVGFTPSTSQIGQIPVLLQNIQLSGTDDSTGQPVSLTAANVTTNLVGDTGFNAINATVVAPMNH